LLGRTAGADQAVSPDSQLATDDVETPPGLRYFGFVMAGRAELPPPSGVGSRMSDEELYRIARAQVEQKRGFWIHLSVYAIVNTGLALLNLATSPGSFWFVFPLIGWGIGLVAHGVYVFLLSGRYGPEWEERQVREEMERLRRARGG